MITQEHNPFAVPFAEVNDIRKEDEIELASRWSRLIAHGIDNIIIVIVFTIIGILSAILATRLNVLNDLTFDKNKLLFDAVYLIGYYIINALLNVSLLRQYGQTIEKKIWALK